MSVVPEKYKSAKATNVDLLSFSKLKGKKEIFAEHSEQCFFDIDNQSTEGKVSIKNSICFDENYSNKTFFPDSDF